MPNHYHFLIYTNQKSIEPVKLGLLESQVLKNCFRLLNSRYSTEYNNKYSRTGSLFRQKTKFKILENRKDNYPFICFNYIHQNPLKAGLVKKMEDWKYSSFQDCLG
jgi:REP element-mobilizing transposase RayT|tara:strand:+ start:359 stop:676 length:318 start_codon:yes stop_codon:yes gene_type:complete